MPTKKYHPDYVNSLRKQKNGCRFPSFFSCNKSWEAGPRLLEVWVGHNGCIQCDWESSHCHSASIANFHSPLASSWMVLDALRWFNCVGKTCFYQPFSFFNTIWNMLEFREIEDAIVFSNESFLYHFSIAIKRHFKKQVEPKKSSFQLSRHPIHLVKPYSTPACGGCLSFQRLTGPTTIAGKTNSVVHLKRQNQWKNTCFFHVFFHEKYCEVPAKIANHVGIYVGFCLEHFGTILGDWQSKRTTCLTYTVNMMVPKAGFISLMQGAPAVSLRGFATVASPRDSPKVRLKAPSNRCQLNPKGWWIDTL